MKFWAKLEMATYKKNQVKAQLVQHGSKGIQSRPNWIK